MEVTIQVVRIYGSDSFYTNGPDPEPILLDNFPERGDRAGVLVGEIPSHVEQAVRLGKALGALELAVKFQRLEVKEPDAFIEERLSDSDFKTFARAFRWNTTLWIERAVEIDDKLSSNHFMWLEPKIAQDYERDLETRAATSLDLLATYLTSVVDPMFLEDVALEDRTVFMANHHEPLCLPKLVFKGGEVTVNIGRQHFDTASLEALLAQVASVPPQRHDWLRTIAHSYLLILRENDNWKRFLWSFVTLEMLTNKLWASFYGEIKSNLRLASVSLDEEIEAQDVIRAISYLLRPDQPDRVPLVKKFATVALNLSPLTAYLDIAIFERLQDARHSLTHGVTPDHDQLPAGDCRVLLDRYIRLAIRKRLGIDDVGENEQAASNS